MANIETINNLSSTEYILTEAAHYNGLSAVAFHGKGGDSDRDLQAIVKRELGYDYNSDSYDEFELAAKSLVEKGFATWEGNHWLTLTSDFSAAYQAHLEANAI